MANTLYQRTTGTATTTDATETSLLTYTLPEATVRHVSLIVLAYSSGGADAACWLIDASVWRSGAGATDFLGAPDARRVGRTNGANQWDCFLDTSGNDVRVRIVGKAATTIYWFGDREGLEFTP